MRYLTITEIVELHSRIIARSGGASGLRDQPALESSVAQPLQSFGPEELYPSIEHKAAALGYFLISNHPFVDGNKRIGHAAMEVFLVLNGRELSASVDDQERIILSPLRYHRWVATPWARVGGRYRLNAVFREPGIRRIAA